MIWLCKNRGSERIEFCFRSLEPGTRWSMPHRQRSLVLPGSCEALRREAVKKDSTVPFAQQVLSRVLVHFGFYFFRWYAHEEEHEPHSGSPFIDHDIS